MENAAIAGGACLLLIALMVGWWVVGGWILMMVWNALLPYLVGAPVISWAQGIALAVGLSIVGGAFRSTVNYVNK